MNVFNLPFYRQVLRQPVPLLCKWLCLEHVGISRLSKLQNADGELIISVLHQVV